MKKRTIIIILLLVLSLGIISLYTTFAYNEENTKLENSTADYNLIYSLKEKSNHQIIVNANDEKYVDVTLTNPYESAVKYGMYYYLVSPKVLPDGLTITMADSSKDLLENTIKPGQTRSVSLKLTNKSDHQVELIVGALVGFEKGKIEDLAGNGEVLIK